MFKNYVTIALRTLRRNPGYSAINVAGLAVGIACCLFIALYIQEELRYDKHHEHIDRLYRMVNASGEDGQPTNANGSYSVGPAVEADIAEVEQAIRFVKMGWGEQRVMAYGEKRFNEGSFYFTDPEVFQVFTFPLVQGDPEEALVAPNTIVITESMAARYFGDEDPMGKALEFDPLNTGAFANYTVTGIMEDLPAQSHIKFEFLASYASLPGPPRGWGYDPVYTYVLLAPDATEEAVEAQLPGFQRKHMGEDPYYSMHLQPVSEIRLHSSLRAEMEPNGSITYIYLFVAIGALILLIACINFMNLSTARSLQRAKEVGLRKTLGAYRGQLVGQFLGEALLLTLFSIAIAFGLMYLAMPVFNNLAEKSVHLADIPFSFYLLSLIGVLLFVGLMAGSYPAFVMSRFKPAQILKGKQGIRTSGSISLRQVLVVFQFAVCIMLFVCTAVVYQQMQYVRTKNLGFERDQIVVLSLNDEIRTRYEAFREALVGEAYIDEVTMSEQVPGRAGNGGGYIVEGVNDGDYISSTRLLVSHRFIETYGIEMVAGRPFDEDRVRDAEEAYVINEAQVNEFGLESPKEALGRTIELHWANQVIPGRIVGVTKNFHLFALRNSLEGVVMNIRPSESLNFLSVRMQTDNVRESLAHLERTWSTFSPNYPFSYYFLDDDFAELHAADARLGRVFAYFALIAIAVACLGLYGLAMFTARQRTREIGVRKVLGASVTSLVGLLSADFLRLVGIAFILAAPIAYLSMNSWLEGFAFSVDIGVFVFFLAAGMAALIALLTVSYQALKAAMADPVKALRYE